MLPTFRLFFIALGIAMLALVAAGRGLVTPTEGFTRVGDVPGVGRALVLQAIVEQPEPGRLSSLASAKRADEIQRLLDLPVAPTRTDEEVASEPNPTGPPAATIAQATAPEPPAPASLADETPVMALTAADGPALQSPVQESAAETPAAAVAGIDSAPLPAAEADAAAERSDRVAALPPQAETADIYETHPVLEPQGERAEPPAPDAAGAVPTAQPPSHPPSIKPAVKRAKATRKAVRPTRPAAHPRARVVQRAPTPVAQAVATPFAAKPAVPPGAAPFATQTYSNSNAAFFGAATFYWPAPAFQTYPPTSQTSAPASRTPTQSQQSPAR